MIAVLVCVLFTIATSGQTPAPSLTKANAGATGQTSGGGPSTEPPPKLTFEFAGNRRTCYYFIPDAEGPLPAIVLLHGSGHNGQIMIDAWKDLASKEHFILIAPDAYDPAGWGVKMDPPEFLHAVVDQVRTKHAIDDRRVYLFGHSAGAVYALILAVIDSRYWAAAAVHAGALPPGYEGQILARTDRRTPIAIWVGDSDLLFHIDAVNATKSLLEANGFPVKLSVLPNHDHNYYAISDKVNKQAWDFLKKSQLKP